MKNNDNIKSVRLNRLIYLLAITNIILACMYINMFSLLKTEAVEESQLLNSVEIDWRKFE